MGPVNRSVIGVVYNNYLDMKTHRKRLYYISPSLSLSLSLSRVPLCHLSRCVVDKCILVSEL